MRLMRSFWYLGGPLGFLLVFFLLPLVLLLGVSLTEGYPLDAVASLGSYRELFVNAFYRSYLITTLAFGLTVTALCLLAGYPLAYFLVRHARRSYRPLLVVVVSPLLVSVVARTVGWTIMLGNDGTLDTGSCCSPGSFPSPSKSCSRRSRQRSAWCTCCCHSWCCR